MCKLYGQPDFNQHLADVPAWQANSRETLARKVRQYTVRLALTRRLRSRRSTVCTSLIRQDSNVTRVVTAEIGSKSVPRFVGVRMDKSVRVWPSSISRSTVTGAAEIAHGPRSRPLWEASVSALPPFLKNSQNVRSPSPADHQGTKRILKIPKRSASDLLSRQ